MDKIHVELCTDCRSLEESVNQTGLHTVGDKRVAIDRTKVLSWINTEKMAADCLTKSMKPGSLEAVMKGHWADINSEKHNGCETRDEIHVGTS